MKKFLFLDRLVLEVTRKCNMNCRHCLRGDAENLDMPKELLKLIFQDVASIGDITFSGGEPTLNVPLIKDCVSIIQEKDIILNSFYTVTNGKVYDKEFVDSLTDLYIYCLKQDFYITKDMKKVIPYIDMAMDVSMCGLAVSIDDYHEDVPIENIMRYRTLSFYSNEKEHIDGKMHLINIGRAKSNGLGGIVLMEQDKVSITEDECGYYVEDLVYISANGDVKLNCDTPYDDETIIGNLYENTLVNILVSHSNL